MKIFITGASSGLGSCLVKEFISQGDTVWGIGRRELKDARILKRDFRYSQCDITIYDQVKDTVEQMIKSDFVPDIVIFCAGSARDDIIESNFVAEKFKENFSVNLFGVLHWVELLLPHFLKRNRGIFAGISSMSIYRENHKNRIGYSASKLAINKSFENLHLEYLGTGIKFVIFNMGRMKEKKDLIGTSYAKAATTIIKILKSGRYSNVVSIPFTQYLLTRLLQFIPEKVFKNFIMKV